MTIRQQSNVTTTTDDSSAISSLSGGSIQQQSPLLVPEQEEETDDNNEEEDVTSITREHVIPIAAVVEMDPSDLNEASPNDANFTEPLQLPQQQVPTATTTIAPPNESLSSTQTLDMRTFYKLEEAIMSVKSFMEEVRDAHLDALPSNQYGLHNIREASANNISASTNNDGAANNNTESCQCNILTSNNNPTTKGLRTVLQKIFTNRDISFTIHSPSTNEDYTIFTVDVLTGRDAEEALLRRTVERGVLSDSLLSDDLNYNSGMMGEGGKLSGDGRSSEVLEREYQEHLRLNRENGNGVGMSNYNGREDGVGNTSSGIGDLYRDDTIGGEERMMQYQMEHQQLLYLQQQQLQERQLDSGSSEEGRYQQYLEQQRQRTIEAASLAVAAQYNDTSISSVSARGMKSPSPHNFLQEQMILEQQRGLDTRALDVGRMSHLQQQQQQRDQEAMIADLTNYYPVAQKKSPNPHQQQQHTGTTSSSNTTTSPSLRPAALLDLASLQQGVESRYLQQRLLLQQQQQQQQQQQRGGQRHLQPRQYHSEHSSPYPSLEQQQQHPLTSNNLIPQHSIAQSTPSTTSTNNYHTLHHNQNDQQQPHPPSSSLVPQDQGAGMLYNPFDSIQGTFMVDTMPFSELSVAAIARGTSGGSEVEGISHIHHNLVSGGGGGGGGVDVNRGGVGSATVENMGEMMNHNQDGMTSITPEEMATHASDEAFRALVREDLSVGSGGGGAGGGGGELMGGLGGEVGLSSSSPLLAQSSLHDELRQLQSLQELQSLQDLARGGRSTGYQRPVPVRPAVVSSSRERQSSSFPSSSSTSQPTSSLQPVVVSQQLPQVQQLQYRSVPSSSTASSNRSTQRNNDSGIAAPATSTAASSSRRQTHQHQQQRRYPNTTDVDIRRVITESQAAHAAHTRRQVDDDIQFRRALEAAAIQSRNEDVLIQQQQQREQQQRVRQRPLVQRIQNDDSEFESQMERAIADSQRVSHRMPTTSTSLPQASSSSQQRQERSNGEDDLVRMISEQSIRDEEQRQRAAQEKYQVEMEMALKLSERLEEEQKRIRSSEEELLEQILEQTKREQEEAQVAEQQLMQRVIRESVDTAEVGGGTRYEEVLEEVLKMSLEEKEAEVIRTAEEEAEQMRKALEWSMYDFEVEREEYEKKRRGI